MNDCLEALERDKLYPSDELLVAFVRYQLVADEAQKLLVRDVMGETSPAPTHVFRNSLLGKLQAARNGSPLHMPVTRKFGHVTYSVPEPTNISQRFYKPSRLQQRFR